MTTRHWTDTPRALGADTAATIGRQDLPNWRPLTAQDDIPAEDWRTMANRYDRASLPVALAAYRLGFNAALAARLNTP